MNKLYHGAHRFLLKQGPLRVLLLSMLAALAMGGLDYWTGFEISFSFFYLIPIVAATIYGGFRNGLLVTIFSILIWTFSNHLAGQIYSNEFIWVWNACVRMAAFTGIAFLLHQLNLSLEHENLLSRTDYLTGIHNTREFYHLAAIELERARTFKHSVSVAYLDLDNFKQVNDRFGHRAGDELLKEIARIVTGVIRRGDLFARVGGDEFVLFFPDANKENIARMVEKVRCAIVEQEMVQQLNVTVSIGVITFKVPLASIDHAIQMADTLMYNVKSHGKDGVIYQVVEA